MNELKLRNKKRPIKYSLKQKSHIVLTPLIILAILLIASGSVMNEVGYNSKVTYLAHFSSVDKTIPLGYNQTFSSAIGIENRAATQVNINSQYGGITYGIWNTGSYTNRTGITIVYNNEKYTCTENSTTYSKTFPAGTFLNYGYGFYYITVTNNNHKMQNVTIMVNTLSYSTKFQYLPLIYLGISVTLIGVLLFATEMTRIGIKKSEGRHLLNKKDWPS